MTAARAWRRARASVRAVLACILLAVTPSVALAQPPDPPSADSQAEPALNLLVRAFGSVDWAATEKPDTPNSFALGQFDLFVTGAINERVSVLAEIVLEASGANTSVVTDLERLQVTFHLDDSLQLSAGRYHTGIGFYNTAFHHGSYFETPIGRPRVFAFEDEGGVLPVHDVGISARGVVPHAGSALRYLAEVGNGRSWVEDEDAEGQDQNGAKSTNLGVSLRPDRWRGLEVGASFYRDEIRDASGSNVRLRIPAAYAIYRTAAAEVMAEWLRLSFRTGSDNPAQSNGGYFQASRAWGKTRPYYRFDRLVIDPLSPLIGGIQSTRAHIVGVRVDPAMWVGLKAQYERSDEGALRGMDTLRTQLVFVF